jgi:hypothetical protein
VHVAAEGNHHRSLEENLSYWLRDHGRSLSWQMLIVALLSLLGGLLVCLFTILFGGMASFFAARLFTASLPWWVHFIVGILGLVALFFLTPPFSEAEEPDYRVTPLVPCDVVTSYLSTLTLGSRNSKLLNLAHIGNLIAASEMIGDILRLGPRLLLNAFDLFHRAMDIRRWHLMFFLVSMLGKLYSEDRKWTLEEFASNPALEFSPGEVADMGRLIGFDGVITLHRQPFGLKMGAELRNCISGALKKQ